MDELNRPDDRRSSRTTDRVTRGPEWAALEEFARQQIQGCLQTVLEQEVTDFLGREKSARRHGARGYRNGHGKARRLAMMAGTITVRRPRLRDLEERFESQVLPLFVKRTEQVSHLLPQLYLHGLAQGDFEVALRGLLGTGAPLSASSIERLRAQWEAEYTAWRQESLVDEEIVYVWADGLYVKAGLADHKAALLVVIGARRDGTKVVLAIESGHRESKEAWGRLLRGLRERGLAPWRVTVADGHLGIWAALGEVYPESAEQRCWNHRRMNVIDHLPRSEWPAAQVLLRAIPYAATRRACERLRDQFVARYGRRYPKAAETLGRDWERLVTFYRFPKAHWLHLRTTNIVESPFNAVRLRTDAARRFKKVASAEALIWKILMVGERNFRRLNSPNLLSLVYQGYAFADGVIAKNKPTGTVAA